MQTNTESYNLSEMNEDQGALLNGEETTRDDYTLAYRFENKNILSRIYFYFYLVIDKLKNVLYVCVYVVHFYPHF